MRRRLSRMRDGAGEREIDAETTAARLETGRRAFEYADLRAASCEYVRASETGE